MQEEHRNNTMQAPSSSPSKLKQTFLKNLFLSLQVANSLSSTADASLEHRKRAVKASADIAMALARGHAHWARSVVTGMSTDCHDKNLVARVLGMMSKQERLSAVNAASYKAARCRKIVQRSCGALRCRRKIKNSGGGGGGGKLVKRRVQVLKKLIPGGEALRGQQRLLSEALDYVSCLKAQVEAMQGLWNAAAQSSN